MFDELLQIKPLSMEVEEALFRFDVFGGSARNFINMAIVADTLEFVEETMVWYFGIGMKDLYPVSCKNILGKISQEFRKSKTEPVNFCYNLVNSMLLHKSVSGEFIWASKFMGTHIINLAFINIVLIILTFSFNLLNLLNWLNSFL